MGGSVPRPWGTEEEEKEEEGEEKEQEEGVTMAPGWDLTSLPCSRCSIAGRSRRVPVPSSGQAMKTEKDEAVATFSLRGKFGTEGAGECPQGW